MSKRIETSGVLAPDQWLDWQGSGFLIRPIGVRIPADPPILVLRRVCTPTGRGSALRAHSVAVRLGPDAPTRSYKFLSQRRFVSLRENTLRYASGEAARLSIGREGFDLPTERQQGVAQPGPECLSRTQEAVGSNPTTLTNSRASSQSRP